MTCAAAGRVRHDELQWGRGSRDFLVLLQQAVARKRTKENLKLSNTTEHRNYSPSLPRKGWSHGKKQKRLQVYPASFPLKMEFSSIFTHKKSSPSCSEVASFSFHSVTGPIVCVVAITPVESTTTLPFSFRIFFVRQSLLSPAAALSATEKEQVG